MKVSGLNTVLTGIKAKLDEGFAEVTNLIQALKDQLADSDVPEDAAATLAQLETAATSLANIVPDVVVEPPIEPSPTEPVAPALRKP